MLNCIGSFVQFFENVMLYRNVSRNVKLHWTFSTVVFFFPVSSASKTSGHSSQGFNRNCPTQACEDVSQRRRGNDWQLRSRPLVDVLLISRARRRPDEDLSRRAGELTKEEIEQVCAVGCAIVVVCQPLERKGSAFCMYCCAIISLPSFVSIAGKDACGTVVVATPKTNFSLLAPFFFC